MLEEKGEEPQARFTKRCHSNQEATLTKGRKQGVMAWGIEGTDCQGAEALKTDDSRWTSWNMVSRESLVRKERRNARNCGMSLSAGWLKKVENATAMTPNFLHRRR